MARLILINGAPASGKSTLAQMYVDEHPLALALDIDVVRSMLGRWLDHPVEAGLIARGMALEMARVQLSAGRDVLIPQFLGRLDFLLELENLAHQAGADFLEVVLVNDSQDAADRFARRSHHPETSAHRDAQALLDRSGGASELLAMHDRLLEVVAGRPLTITVPTVDGEIDRAYRDLRARVD